MENNNTPSSPQAPTGAVMDVQPPKNGQSSTQVAEKPEVTGTPVVVETPTAAEVTEQPAAPAEETNQAEITANDNPTPATADSQPTENNPLAIDSAAHTHKSNVPVAAIALAVLIAIVLIGITVFAYIRTKNDGAATTTKTNLVQPKVTTQDVDQTSTEIDGTVNKVDDTKDFAGEDLTDKALGL
jgi:hypothetical protein